jgi:P-type conjugative transfer protein TrbJ
MRASTVLLSALFSVALPCAAQFVCDTCATEPTQWLNHAQLVLQVAKSVALLENAIQQAKTMGMPGNSLGQELANISNVLQAGQALNQATANLQQRWDGTWGTPPMISTTTGFRADFAKWSTAAQNSLRAAMLAGQLSHIQQNNAVAVLTQIEGFLNVLDSRNKAIQTAAAGTMRTASSVEKMHDTMLSQGTAQQVFMQYQLQKDMQQQALEQRFFAPAEIPRDNKGY